MGKVTFLSKIIFPCIFSFFTALATCAQNLVPNPGFERFEVESGGHAFLDNVDGWYNPNKLKNTPLYGTPDHMYATSNESFERVRYSFNPFEGRSTAGIITYMQRVPNYREYLSVQLKKPLIAGQRYRVSFYVTNGYKASFGNIAASGLGFCLSTYPLEQRVYEPLPVTPQFQMEAPFFSTEWQKITHEFKAELAYEYLTIGSFLTDGQTIKRYINYDVDPQTYFYIDQVVVEEAEEKETIALEAFEEVVPSRATDFSQSQPVPKEEPIDSEAANRQIDQQAVVQLPEREATIKIWDEKDVDGDIVSLQFNGQWILRDYTLKKRKKSIKIVFQPDSDNLLVLFAHNLGRNPPNTAAFVIKSGKKEYYINIRSDLEYSGAIRFVK